MSRLQRLRFATPIIVLILLCFTYLRGYCQSSPPSNAHWTLYLKPITAREITQSWRGPKQGRTVAGEKLEVLGIPYQNIFGVHASSEIVFDLNKRFSTFTTKVGMPDYLTKGSPSSRNKGSVVFEIIGDGARMWKSPVIRPGSAPISAEINVSEIDVLKLVVTNAGDGNDNDHACWIEPTLDSYHVTPPSNASSVSRSFFLAPDGIPWSDEEVLQFQELSGRGVDPQKVREALRPDRWDLAPTSDVPLKWRTCAVVGSSQNLLSHAFGQAIDSHDAVFRINNAPTRGYERFVGSKTTLRFFHRTAPLTVPRDLNERRVFVFISWDDFLRISEVIKTREGRKNTLVLSPRVVLETQNNWVQSDKGWPTTGLLAVRLALSTCDAVSVFGFGLDAKGLYGHYYRPTVESLQKSPHDVPREHFILDQLAKEGRIVRFPNSATSP